MVFRVTLVTISLTLLVSCTITQRANPAAGLRVSATEICVIEKLDVREDFRAALLASLRQRGFSVRPYNAKYSWDLKTYMAWAELIAYKDGVRAGDALYSAPTGGWAMTTRIYESTESKVNTMVSQLFPE
jgi:hypothetical protein